MSFCLKVGLEFKTLLQHPVQIDREPTNAMGLVWRLLCVNGFLGQTYMEMFF